MNKRGRKPKKNHIYTRVYCRENQSKWTALLKYKEKLYYLGVFEKKEDAIKTKDIALQKLEENCFEEWFNTELSEQKHKKRNGVVFLPVQKKWNSYVCFNKRNYYLGNFEEKEDAENIHNTAKEMIKSGTFLEWYDDYHKKLKESNKAGHRGVYLQNKTQWRAEIGYNKKQYYLGTFKEKKDAIKIRKIAEQKIRIGNFEDWYENVFLKSNKDTIVNHKTSLCKGVVYNSETKLYHAYIYHNKKKYSLCYSNDVRKEAEKHKSDFIEWFNDYKLKNKSEPVSKETGIYFHKKTQTWFSLIYYKSKKYVLGYFKDKEEAINIRKIAESYKNNGTFLEWFNDYKNLKKNRK